MADIAVVGESKFILGFQLAGIKHTIETNKPEEVLDAMSDRRFGVVIIDESIMKGFNEFQKAKVLDSINPVAVLLSEKQME